VPRSDRTGALLGLAAVAGNVLGVAFLADVPAAYRPAQLDPWVAGSLAHPRATAASAVAFVLGLLALAGWARAAGRAVGGRLARAGGGVAAAGALLNAAGCVTPLVLALHVGPGCAGDACAVAGRALLGVTLSLDALFNLLLGVGLLLLGGALSSRGRPVLAALGAVAGLLSLPVAGQVAFERAASLLALAAPLWLAFILATSALLWRGATRPRRAAAPGGAGGGDASLARAR
jgi:hypothetical protein